MDKVTTSILKEMKSKGEKITMLTAYDYLMASLLDEAGIDILMVGDSVGNVFLGYDNTLPVTMEDMIHHTAAVARGVKRAMVIGDMPFMSYQASLSEAIRNAGRFLKEAGAVGVKLEGGAAVADTATAIVKSGIPVMGHLGLTPQSIHLLGGYGLQAKDEAQAEMLISDARMLEEAGCFSLVLEKIPSKLARQVTEAVSIPTIGIGAGKYCDGQVLVTPDMLGMFKKFTPKFAKQYAQLGKAINSAASSYIKEVKTQKFPGKEHSFE
ncbi:MAG: 3-methyl-2-oxobutanoate hydroxymethyltransferase [Actinobacteria bacterium]|nr:MAG: 3-methyl-2-oxobutanoate hydroxymethyltransferase [Actinomycetota bacterium]